MITVVEKKGRQLHEGDKVFHEHHFIILGREGVTQDSGHRNFNIKGFPLSSPGFYPHPDSTYIVLLSDSPVISPFGYAIEVCRNCGKVEGEHLKSDTMGKDYYWCSHANCEHYTPELKFYESASCPTDVKEKGIALYRTPMNVPEMTRQFEQDCMVASENEYEGDSEMNAFDAGAKWAYDWLRNKLNTK